MRERMGLLVRMFIEIFRTQKAIKTGLALGAFVCVVGVGFIGEKRVQGTESSSPKPLIETLLSAYLLPGKGEIMGRVHLPRESLEVSSSSPQEVQVFGRYKKFKKGPLEVIQVVWTQLGKEENKKLVKEKIHCRIESVFPCKGSMLEKATVLDLKGDQGAFVRQVKSFMELSSSGEGETKKEKESSSTKKRGSETDLTERDKEEKYEQKEKASSSQRSSGVSSSGAIGLYALPLGEKKKDPNPSTPPSPAPSSQSLPQRVETQTPSTPVRERVTTKWEIRGCAPVVDFAQEQVIIQKKKITLINGRETEVGPCEGSSERYPVKYEYQECPDLVDREARKAYRQYRRFWVDGEGQIQRVDEGCQKDERQCYALEEASEGCPFESDFESLVARPQSALIYHNHQGMRVVVEECRPTTDGESLTIVRDFQGWRHDFETGCSYKQYRFSLEQRGVRHYLSSLSEDPGSFLHQKTTQTCSLFHDPVSRNSYIQERIYLETPEGPLWISECRVGDQLLETENGCEGLFEHDIPAQVSRSYTRGYYEREGERIYMTPCQVSTRTYPHHKRVLRYSHKDDEKNSYPLVQTYLRSSLGEEVIIQTLQNDSPQSAKPYTLEASVPKAFDDEKRYEGCFELTPMGTIHRYRRADDSFFEEVGPERTLQKSRNLCVKREETRTTPTSSWESWNVGRNAPLAYHSHLNPRGSASGHLTCAQLFSNHAPHKFPNMALRLVHSESLSRRTNTHFPDGRVTYGVWEQISAPQQVRSQICTL